MGYSCFVSGTFVWFAAGGAWSTAIRVAGPVSGAVGVNYAFYDTVGSTKSLDTMVDNVPASFASGDTVNFALFANQPAEVELLGGANNGPSYSVTAEGSVYVVFFCPDAITCATVSPQLIYSALPTYPWSLSVPIAWDVALATQWSAVGIDDGHSNVVSLVVYNEDTTAMSFTVDVYDSNGKLAGTASTPTIAPLQRNSFEGGTYATLLSDLISPLPAGPFKILVDGHSALSAIEVLQISGTSATTLQVMPDTGPKTASGVMAHQRLSAARAAAFSPKPVFRPLPN